MVTFWVGDCVEVREFTYPGRAITQITAGRIGRVRLGDDVHLFAEVIAISRTIVQDEA